MSVPASFATTRQLTPDAIEMLGQLFVNGPVWDGNCVSKAGRTMLVELGLAERGDGWQWLTRFGVETALSMAGWRHPGVWDKWRKKAAAL